MAQVLDLLRRIGRRHAVVSAVRGLIVWVGVAAVVCLLVVLGAATGGPAWAMPLLIAGGSVLAVAAVLLIVWPLVRRPDPAAMARLVESRVDGLHDGLSNVLRLSRASDLAANPWLPQIYDEVLDQTRRESLDRAVPFQPLKAPAVFALLVVLLVVATAGMLRARVVQGFRQLVQPTEFVPTVGAARLVSVLPGHVRLPAGKPLELAVVAELPPTSLGQGDANLRLILEPVAPATGRDPSGRGVSTSANDTSRSVEILPASMTTDPAGVRTVRYVHRVDPPGGPLRYRVEVGGTQSSWYDVGIVRDIKLTELSLTVTPPAYLNRPTETRRLTAEQVASVPLTVPEGSRLSLVVTLDEPVQAAVLQLHDGQVPPTAMSIGDGGRRLEASFTAVRDTPVAILPTDAAGQALFRLPAERWVIGVQKDAPPTIEPTWPKQDVTVRPGDPIRLAAVIRDDTGLAAGRVLVAVEGPGPTSAPATSQTSLPPSAAATQSFSAETREGQLSHHVELPVSLRVDGTVVRVQFEAVDRRDLGPAAVDAWRDLLQTDDPSSKASPQTTRSAVFTVRLVSPPATSPSAQPTQTLVAAIKELLTTQQRLVAQTKAAAVAAEFVAVRDGQSSLRAGMLRVAETAKSRPEYLQVHQALLMLAAEAGQESIDLANLAVGEPSPAGRERLRGALLSQQRRVIAALESLVELVERPMPAATQPASSDTRPAGVAPGLAAEQKMIDAALQDYIQRQQKIIEQSAAIVKKPIRDFDDADRKLLQELTTAQENLDAFMQQKAIDLSKLVDQGAASTDLLKDVMEIRAEVTMASGALKESAFEIFVPASEFAVALATAVLHKEERWLPNRPDRTRWAQEDPAAQPEVPLAKLPPELEDLIGELLEQEEDLLEVANDVDANWHGSMDKGIAWDVMDGPISNSTAKGAIGNQLPNDNSMTGRSGEGRSGRSQGEMVEDTATGKGGRRTPTRLDPTSFQQGQVKDTSREPTGGATGGGKIAGQGGQGLTGLTPAQRAEMTQRLAQRQAELRNSAERLNLQHQLPRYDRFRLLESIALMRRIEADLAANRYQSALRRKDVLLERLDTSRLLTGAAIHVTSGTTPDGPSKRRRDVADAMKGELPPAWRDALQKYYERLSEE